MGEITGIFPERRSPGNSFIDLLLLKGSAELNSPPDLAGRKFTLVHRVAGNRAAPDGTIGRDAFRDRGRFVAGYTDAHALDLFEDLSVNGQHVWFPVAHCDMDVATRSDGVVIADGNFPRHRSEMAKFGPLPHNPYFEPMELADKYLGPLENGIDVLGVPGADSTPYERGLRHELENLGLGSHDSWKGHKLGNLLFATQMLMLKRRNVQTVEYGSISGDFDRITRKFGFAPGVSKIPLSRVPDAVLETMVSAFVPPGLR